MTIFRSRRSGMSPTTFGDRKSTRLNSSHGYISYAVFCLKKKKNAEYSHASHTTKTSRLVHTNQPLAKVFQILNNARKSLAVAHHIQPRLATELLSHISV